MQNGFHGIPRRVWAPTIPRAEVGGPKIRKGALVLANEIRTSDYTCTGSPAVVVAAPPISFDGDTRCRFTFWAPNVYTGVTSSGVAINLLRSGINQGEIDFDSIFSGGTKQAPRHAFITLTPPAGVWTYAFGAWTTSPGGIIFASVGGVTSGIGFRIEVENLIRY